MRKCIRCNVLMIDDLKMMVSSGEYGLDIREKGIFKGSLGKVKVSVCPECGYVETYIENTDKVREVASKRNM